MRLLIYGGDGLPTLMSNDNRPQIVIASSAGYIKMVIANLQCNTFETAFIEACQRPLADQAVNFRPKRVAREKVPGFSLV